MGTLKLGPAQVKRIIELRGIGLGYRAIAQDLGCSRDTVRNYCKANGLDGLTESNLQQDTLEGRCLQCGEPIQERPDHRGRKFCSDACRWKWWNSPGRNTLRPSGNREQLSCLNCGKLFTSYKSRARRYCSHECYIRDRFWRLEDGRDPYVSPSKT